MHGEGGGKGAILFVAVLCLLLGCLRWARLVMRSRVYCHCNLAELCGHNLSCTLLQMKLTSPESVRMFSSIRLPKGLERKSKLFFLRVYSLRTEFASLQSSWICRAVRMPKDRVPYHEWLKPTRPNLLLEDGLSHEEGGVLSIFTNHDAEGNLSATRLGKYRHAMRRSQHRFTKQT